MTPEQAAAALSILITATPDERKWTNDKVDFWTRELMTYNDADCAVKACYEVAHNGFLPPQPKDVYEAYKAQIVRRELAAPTHLDALEEGRREIPWRQGVELAWRNYEDERRKLGREPSRPHFESWLAWGTGKPLTREEVNAMTGRG